MDFNVLVPYTVLLLGMAGSSLSYIMNWVPAEVHSSMEHSHPKRLVTSNDNLLWPKGVVPYVFTDNLSQEKKEAYKLYVFPTYEKYSCIRFVPWTSNTQSTEGLSHNNYLRFDEQGGKCESFIGKVKKNGQTIFGCKWQTCLHEIGHALGFVHEQQNPLREEFVRINYHNVKPDLAFAFEKEPSYMPYHMFDFNSLMHYALRTFSKNKLKTIDLLDENMRPYPEHVDREAYYYFFYQVNERYKCTADCTITCHNGGYKALLDGKCGCRCPQGLDPSTKCKTLLKEDHDCGDIITLSDNDPTATISSPSINANKNVTCYWLIKSPENSKILLDFPDFNVRKTSGQCVDEVDVKYYMPGAFGAQFCGDSFKKVVQSYKNDVLISFTQSNLGTGSSSFKASLSMIRDEDFCFDVENKGHNYAGPVDHGDNFRPCLNWDEVRHCRHSVFNPRDFGANLEGNTCRNPDGANRPWCYTEPDLCQRTYCDACRLGVCKDIFTNCQSEMSSNSNFCTQGSDAVRGCRKSCGLCANFAPLTKVSQITCPMPTLPSDAATTSLKNSYTLGEKVTVTCGTDSSVVRKIVCLSSGQWTHLNFVCGTCTDGWVNFKDRCYQLFHDKIKRDKAKTKCAAAHTGGKLFTDHDSEVHDFITTNFKHETGVMEIVWMGMNKKSDGSYKWTSGSSAITWKNWSQNYPSSNNHDCVVMAVDDTWKDKSCGITNKYICQYSRDEPTICVDQRPDCDEILTRNPDTCERDRNTFATVNCPYTCAICGTAASQVTCSDEGTGKNVGRSAATVVPGQHIKYTCNAGYNLVTGNLLRACTIDGTLTGSSPQCLGILKYNWPVNTLPIHDREEVGAPGRVYLADNDYMTVPIKGKIFSWRFYSKFDGQVALQVWRKTSSSTSYKFVGQNIISSTMEDREREIKITDDADRILVQQGDIVGVYYHKTNPGGIPFDECASGQVPALMQLESESLWSKPGEFTKGSTYSFTLMKNKCRLFALSAMVDSK